MSSECRDRPAGVLDRKHKESQVYSGMAREYCRPSFITRKDPS